MNSRAVSASMTPDATPDARRPRSPGAFRPAGSGPGSDLGHPGIGLVPLALETVRGGGPGTAHAVHLALELLRGGLGLLPRPAPRPGSGQETEPESSQRPHAKQLHSSLLRRRSVSPCQDSVPRAGGGQTAAGAGRKTAPRPPHGGGGAGGGGGARGRVAGA